MMIIRVPGEHGGIFHTENLRALQEKSLAPELLQAISISMHSAIVMRPSLKHIAENRLKYLDHVYTRGCLYSFWDRLLGRKFS